MPFFYALFQRWVDRFFGGFHLSVKPHAHTTPRADKLHRYKVSKASLQVTLSGPSG